MQKTFNKKMKGIIMLIAIATIAVLCFSVAPINAAHAQSIISKEVYYGVPVVGEDIQTRSTTQETINYSWKDTEEDYANQYFPEYYNTNSNLSNACAPVAGSMIIGFYDRSYTNLIPNYTPGKMVGSYYRYYSMSSYGQEVINSLYSSMSTNYPLPGTSQSQYNTGLTTYVTGQGYSINYTGIVSNNVINYNSGTSSLVTQISYGRPISLFLSGYNICTLVDDGSSMSISKTTYTGNHIMIAYGYRKIKYYNSSNYNFRTDLYLKVSTGFQANKTGWYFAGTSGTVLNDAESANIY